MIETLSRRDPLGERKRDITIKDATLPPSPPRRGTAHVVRVEPIVPRRWVAYLEGHRKVRVFAVKSLALVYARHLASARAECVMPAIADDGTVEANCTGGEKASAGSVMR